MTWDKIGFKGIVEINEAISSITDFIDNALLDENIGVYALIEKGLEALRLTSTFSNVLEQIVVSLISTTQDYIDGLLGSGFYAYYYPFQKGGKQYLVERTRNSFGNTTDSGRPKWNVDNDYGYFIILFGGSLNAAINASSLLGQFFNLPVEEKLVTPVLKVFPGNQLARLAYNPRYVGSSALFERRIIIERRTLNTQWVVLEDNWNQPGYRDFDVLNDTTYRYRIRLISRRINDDGIVKCEAKSHYSLEVPVTPYRDADAVLFSYSPNRWMSIAPQNIALLRQLRDAINNTLENVKDTFVEDKNEYDQLLEGIETKIYELQALIAEIQNMVNEFTQLISELSSLTIYVWQGQNRGTSEELYGEMLSAFEDETAPYFINSNTNDITIGKAQTGQIYTYQSRQIKILKHTVNGSFIQYIDTGESAILPTASVVSIVDLSIVGGLTLVASSAGNPDYKYEDAFAPLKLLGFG